MKKIYLLISLIILCIAPLTSISASGRRYISLAPSTTEILFALGLGDEVVGVSSFCNYPEAAKSKEKIGDFSRPNMEKILSLKPDYVFCTGLEQAPAIAELRRQELNVYVADPKNMQELFDSIKEIGKIANKREEAERLIDQMRYEVESITSKVKDIPLEIRPKVFIEIWHEPLSTAGKGSFIDDLINLAGGINIASETRRAFSIFSPEEVIKRNPGHIILAYMSSEAQQEIIKERFGWGQIEAVKKNRIYNDINPDLLLRPGPRVVEGLKKIHERLYPQENERRD
jgi:iron complex transport system substrate-binding protein